MTVAGPAMRAYTVSALVMSSLPTIALQPISAATTALALLLFVSPFCAFTSALFSARVTHHVLLTAGIAPLLMLAVLLFHAPDLLRAWRERRTGDLWRGTMTFVAVAVAFAAVNPPAGITVPASDPDGVFTVAWTASPSTGIVSMIAIF